jgi:heme-degrading monooxygenase HmoA
MYGTIWTARVKPGQEQVVEELAQRWLREHAPATPGFIADYVIKVADRPGEVAGLTIFDSEANYRRNAADPAQARWYQQFRATLEAAPVWHDGEIVKSTVEAVAL